MNLEEYFQEYKALTLDIMERASEDGSIGYLVEERQAILDKILQGSYKTSDIEVICKKLKLVELNNELNILIKKEMVNTKIKIEKIKKMKTANMQYVSFGYVPSTFNKHM